MRAEEPALGGGQARSAGSRVDMAKDQLAYTGAACRFRRRRHRGRRRSRPGRQQRPDGGAGRALRRQGRRVRDRRSSLLTARMPAAAGNRRLPAEQSGRRADGVVREISPIADPATRTFQVKVDAATIRPSRCGLAAASSAASRPSTAPVVVLPGSALFDKGGKPAVWVVDPATATGGAQAVTRGPLRDRPRHGQRRPCQGRHCRHRRRQPAAREPEGTAAEECADE